MSQFGQVTDSVDAVKGVDMAEDMVMTPTLRGNYGCDRIRQPPRSVVIGMGSRPKVVWWSETAVVSDEIAENYMCCT